MVTRDKLRKALERVSDFVGRTNLRFIVERIIYDLSVTNPSLKGVEVPEDPTELNLERFGDEDVERFYYLLADISGSLVGEFLKEELLREVES